MSSYPLVDPQMVQMLKQIGAFGEIIEVLTASAKQRLSAIQQGLAAHDRKQIKFEAHGFKSASLQSGALRLGKLCHALEESAESATWPKIEDQLSMIEAAWTLTSDALCKFRD